MAVPFAQRAAKADLALFLAMKTVAAQGHQHLLFPWPLARAQPLADQTRGRLARRAVIHAHVAAARGRWQVRHQGHHGNAGRRQPAHRLDHRRQVRRLQQHAVAAVLADALQLVDDALHFQGFMQVKARAQHGRMQRRQFRFQRGAHGVRKAARRHHQHVEHEFSAGQAHLRALPRQFIERLHHAAHGIRVHAPALLDHAVDGRHADAGLQRHDLDGKRMRHAMPIPLMVF
ncbi:hypothetical protein D3C85_503480 [compost metagenome]